MTHLRGLARGGKENREQKARREGRERRKRGLGEIAMSLRLGPGD
jgi:hypothetical protein